MKVAVEELYEWLNDNSKSPQLRVLSERIQAANRELLAKDFKAATASFAKLLVEVMQEIRQWRKEDEEGQVDY